MRVAELLQQARQAGLASVVARALLQHVLQVGASFVLTHPEDPVTVAATTSFLQLQQRYLDGEPLAYLLGEVGFCELSFLVNPAVLIPREDTELLVTLAARYLDNAKLDISVDAWQILELGTGSGAISCVLAHRYPQLQCLATERHPAALMVAAANRQRHTLSNLQLLAADWLTAFSDGLQVALIVSNPPYVAETDPSLDELVIRFEPRSAWYSENNGMADLQAIILQARCYLQAAGLLLLEHGYQQGAAVRQALGLAGFVQVFSERDAAGYERVSGGYKPA
jgi:release factor glutamine methyltransferase